MSMELHVFCPARKLPDIRAWQAAIDAHGFDVKLAPDTDVSTTSGFVPAVFKDRDSGFEFDISPASELVDVYPDLAELLHDMDMVGNFRWGGDLDELACTLAAAAALTSLTSGLWFDPQEGECRDAAGAIEEAHAGIAAADN